MDNSLIENLVVPRFMNYARYWTTSDRHVAETPSTPGQWDLAKALAEELRFLGIGLEDRVRIKAGAFGLIFSQGVTGAAS
ncbi:MAG: hypothetical protein LBT93_00960 [Treponema sp.]|jgi:tripeptide aminopeptidase|nr:hypothetical protein [Treponema sp.]